MDLRTGLVLCDRYLEHDTGPHHPEHAGRLAAILRHFQASGLAAVVQKVEPRLAELEAVARVHEADYVERFHATCAAGEEWVDTPECPVSAESFEIARLASGGVLAAVDAVMAAHVRNAFCAVRPPGHHAERGYAMGFCFFNNTAIAAEHLRARHGLSRVAVIDWDVHHGNGTQHHFESDPDVLVCNIHQHPHTLFPGTGFEWEKGCGEGVGATVNCPMMPGATDEDYRRAFDQIILPTVDAFRPEFVLVSTGFDAHAEDPLAQIELSTDSFGWMTDAVVELAEAHCGGRLVTVLEGGYDLRVLGECAQLHVERLAGMPPAIE